MTYWNVTSVAAILSGSHHSTLAPESIGVNGERATMSVFMQFTVAITRLIPDHVGLLFTSKIEHYVGYFTIYNIMSS